MTKKYKTQVVKDLKQNPAAANRLGSEGWRLVTVDKDGDGVFEQEQPVKMEYTFYPVPMMRRGGESALVLDEAVAAMAADGWRLAGVTFGPRVMDSAMVFEREAQ